MASSYLKAAFDPRSLRKIAKGAYDIAVRLEADVIVGRGLSGAIVAAAIGANHGMPFAIVRKPGDGSHSSWGVEVQDAVGYSGHGDWLIVDDFIVSGYTIREIAKAVKEHQAYIRGRCVGIVLYNSGGAMTEFLLDPDDAESMVPIFRVFRTEEYNDI